MYTFIVGIALLLVAPSYQNVQLKMGRTKLSNSNKLNNFEETWFSYIKYKKDVIKNNEQYIIHLLLEGGPDNERHLLYTIANVSGSNLRSGMWATDLNTKYSSETPPYGTLLIILNGVNTVAKVIKDWSSKCKEHKFQITAAVFNQKSLIESGTLPHAEAVQRRFKDYEELTQILDQFCQKCQSGAMYGTLKGNCNIADKTSAYVDSYSWSINM